MCVCINFAPTLVPTAMQCCSSTATMTVTK